ncbi:outer membrane beta-barrel protein [Ancylomarina longa]|uniref:PorT family protein n=1 Tax=Ancylomarina longa TaxID=2487017 RepID=A0A434AWE7_9BACT|nr:outer membrane beta-barrel protein [Ancylomarina longa]RUT78812.1 PorT family protein [Ancylomarina longa]
MKKFLMICLSFSLCSILQAQNVQDTLQSDSLKKKNILIEDSWSTKPQKHEIVKKDSFHISTNNSDTTKLKFMKKNIVKVVEEDNGAKIKIGKIGKLSYQEDRDTTKIRIGGKQINIIDGWHGTRVRIEKVQPWDPNQDKFFVEEEKDFRGHWAGFEMGINGLAEENYSGYISDLNGFIDLNLAKSIAVNLNFLQYDISLQKERNTIGLVTGLGLEWNNYRFDSDMTLEKDISGKIQPVGFNPEWNIKKSKLTSIYLTVPLLLEFQIPVKYNTRRVHLAAGVVGGLRLGTHSKIKYKFKGNTHKDKDHDDFNLKTLRYGAQVRLGYRSLNLFGTYGLTNLFEKNKGPEMVPYTVGITLVTF